MIHIYSCNYNSGKHIEEQIQSLVKQKNKNFRYTIIDNDSRDSSYEYIKQNKIDLPSYSIIFNEKNIGKAKAINDVISNDKHIKDGDIVFSLDSDISLISDEYITLIYDIWNLYESKVSCLVGSQSCNSLFKRQIKYNISKNGYEYFVPQEGYGNGIAGGALITSYENWKLIGGYDTTKGIYGSVDGIGLLKLYTQTKKPICVINNLMVYHPDDDDIGYREWKDKVQHQQLTIGKCIEEKGFYDL